MSFDQAPGTQKQDCKSCPEGKHQTRLYYWFHSSDMLSFYCNTLSDIKPRFLHINITNCVESHISLGTRAIEIRSNLDLN